MGKVVVYDNGGVVCVKTLRGHQRNGEDGWEGEEGVGGGVVCVMTFIRPQRRWR